MMAAILFIVIIMAIISIFLIQNAKPVAISFLEI
jgi:hypothetical protein